MESGEKKEYLEIIQENSSLLLQLINDILDLSV
ncbi:histidine kinase dimerization/phospho-acceptor domain-containing protein [uncultured Bacteroides sp.]